MVSTCLAELRRMGQQQQQGIKFTGVVYATAAPQLMKMIYASRAHRTTDTADTDSASALYHHYVRHGQTTLPTNGAPASSSTASDTGSFYALPRHRQGRMFSLTSLPRAFSDPSRADALNTNPCHIAVESRISRAKGRGGCVPKIELVRLKAVQERWRTARPDLLKLAQLCCPGQHSSDLDRCSTPQGRIRRPNVFGASVTEKGEETRVPVDTTNHCIRTVCPSTHHSSR